MGRNGEEASVVKLRRVAPTKRRGARPIIVPSSRILCRLTSLFQIFNSSAHVGVLCTLRSGRLYIRSVTGTIRLDRSTIDRRLQILGSAGLIHFHQSNGAICCTLSSSRIEDVLSVNVSRVRRWARGTMRYLQTRGTYLENPRGVGENACSRRSLRSQD